MYYFAMVIILADQNHVIRLLQCMYMLYIELLPNPNKDSDMLQMQISMKVYLIKFILEDG